MKKIVAMLLACMLVFSCLSLASAEDKPTLTVWMPVYQFGDGPDDLTFWTEKLAPFAEANNCVINIEIKPWTDYYTNAYTALASDDAPDVVYGPTFDMMNNGLLLPLNDYFTAEDADNYLYWAEGSRDAKGNLYVIPMMVGNACVTFFNMDILAKSGITELPTTWDGFLEMCKTIKATQPDVWPFLQNWGASSGTSALMTCFWPLYFQAGGTVLDENGKPSINNEAGLKTLEYIKSFMDAGIFDETITAEGSAIDRFVNGELAACVAGTGKSKSFANVNWQFALSMEGPAGVATLVPSEGIGCSVKTKYPELAAGIVKTMTSGSVMDEFHSKVYSMAKITKDATFSDDPAFEAIYSEQASSLYALPGFVASGSFEETLRGNIQLMLMGEMTAQEVLDETMNYYNDQILE